MTKRTAAQMLTSSVYSGMYGLSNYTSPPSDLSEWDAIFDSIPQMLASTAGRTMTQLTDTDETMSRSDSTRLLWLKKPSSK